MTSPTEVKHPDSKTVIPGNVMNKPYLNRECQRDIFSWEVSQLSTSVVGYSLAVGVGGYQS